MAAVSRCALFRKKDNLPYMVSREHLEGLFCESAPPILELSELRKRCGEKQLDDRDLQVSHAAMHIHLAIICGLQQLLFLFNMSYHASCCTGPSAVSGSV